MLTSEVDDWMERAQARIKACAGVKVGTRDFGVWTPPTEPAEPAKNGFEGDVPVVLISCVSEKSSSARCAAELYVSDWFLKAKAYAEAKGARWLILSAKWGVVHPEVQIPTYELSLNDFTKKERTAWGNRVAASLARTLCYHTGTVDVLAGVKYREAILASLDARSFAARVSVPMQGLGIGQQKQWLAKNTPTSTPMRVEEKVAVSAQLGYVARRRAKDAAKLAQRKCQRKGCDCSLPVNAIARQKFCSDQCRIKANAAVRPARDQSHRTEYHKLYQRRRRERMAQQ